MSEMPDGWSVDVDGEKVVVNFPVEDSPSIGRFASRFLHKLQAVPFRAPSGDFATGVECEEHFTETFEQQRYVASPRVSSDSCYLSAYAFAWIASPIRALQQVVGQMPVQRRDRTIG